ncbi:MAG: hypothetical protein HY903_21850 [Deltaproteobacteria bacterium]|nr:hypothetical protein [Deltaproteobacteria bacterium]
MSDMTRTSLPQAPVRDTARTAVPVTADTVPMFNDEAAIARAIIETGLTAARVRAVVEAQAWYQICAGVMGVTGGDTEARVAAYLARFPRMFEDRDEEMPTLSNEDEATFIAETTDIFEDETTRVLASVRAYEAEIGLIDPGAVEDYRAWRVAWLTHVARPRIVRVGGKIVVYSFAEAILREQNLPTR